MKKTKATFGRGRNHHSKASIHSFVVGALALLVAMLLFCDENKVNLHGCGIEEQIREQFVGDETPTEISFHPDSNEGGYRGEIWLWNATEAQQMREENERSRAAGEITIYRNETENASLMFPTQWQTMAGVVKGNIYPFGTIRKDVIRHGVMPALIKEKHLRAGMEKFVEIEVNDRLEVRYQKEKEHPLMLIKCDAELLVHVDVYHKAQPHEERGEHSSFYYFSHLPWKARVELRNEVRHKFGEHLRKREEKGGGGVVKGGGPNEAKVKLDEREGNCLNFIVHFDDVSLTQEVKEYLASNTLAHFLADPARGQLVEFEDGSWVKVSEIKAEDDNNDEEENDGSGGSLLAAFEVCPLDEETKEETGLRSGYAMIKSMKPAKPAHHLQLTYEGYGDEERSFMPALLTTLLLPWVEHQVENGWKHRNDYASPLEQELRHANEVTLAVPVPSWWASGPEGLLKEMAAGGYRFCLTKVAANKGQHNGEKKEDKEVLMIEFKKGGVQDGSAPPAAAAAESINRCIPSE